MPDAEQYGGCGQPHEVWSSRRRELSVHASCFEPCAKAQLGDSAGVSAATRDCPETATKLPGCGHEFCPLTVMGSARHDVVCLAAFRG
jgi:hypothetical protein